MLHMTSAQCAARNLHMIAPGHLSVCVGDSSQHSEGIVTNLELHLSVRLLLLLLLLKSDVTTCLNAKQLQNPKSHQYSDLQNSSCGTKKNTTFMNQRLKLLIKKEEIFTGSIGMPSENVESQD